MFVDGYPTKVDSKSYRCVKRSRAEESPLQQHQQLDENPCCIPSRNRQTFSNASLETHREGKFLIQVSFEKLRQVEDHESCLRRSVLINNTLKLVHNEIYGVKMPFGLTSAMSMNLDANVNMGDMSLTPSRKRRKRFLNEINPDACPCRRKTDEAENFVQQCERCTLSQALSEELEDEVFQNECLHLEKEPSIFSELDSVFHSFVCALET